MRAQLVVIILALLAIEALAAIPSNANAQADQVSPHSSMPSLQLHVMLMGKNMNIHGQTIFDVFVKPIISIDGTSVHYDGFATFIQDDSQITYILVDGTSYVVEASGNDTTSAASQTVHCHSSTLPFDAILPALNNATPVPSASVWGEPVGCPDGALLQTSFSDTGFVLCASGQSGLVAYSDEIMVEVAYLDGVVRTIPAPRLTSNDGSCTAAEATDTVVTPTTLALLSGNYIPVFASNEVQVEGE